MRIHLGIFALLAGLISGALHLPAQTSHPAPTNPEALATQMREAATRAYDRLSQKNEVAQLTSENVELLFLWSQRISQSERLISKTPGDHLKSAQAHLARLTLIDKRIDCTDNDNLAPRQLTYYIALANAEIAVLQQPSAPQIQPADAVQKTAQAVSDAVIQKSEIAQEDFRILHLRYRWSKRLAQAQIAAANTATDRLSAANAHLQRMTDLRKHTLSGDGADHPQDIHAALDFFIADAHSLIPQPSTQPQISTKERLVMAQKYMEVLQRIEEILQVTPGFVEFYQQASQSLADAEYAAANTPAEKRNALTAHRNRSAAQFKSVASTTCEGNPDAFSPARFFANEAELQLLTESLTPQK